VKNYVCDTRALGKKFIYRCDGFAEFKQALKLRLRTKKCFLNCSPLSPNYSIKAGRFGRANPGRKSGAIKNTLLYRDSIEYICGSINICATTLIYELLNTY
jgi:hypothetical protein